MHGNSGERRRLLIYDCSLSGPQLCQNVSSVGIQLPRYSYDLHRFARFRLFDNVFDWKDVEKNIVQLFIKNQNEPQKTWKFRSH